MTDAVTLTISGIKCDNPDCDYRDDSVTRESYLEYVNKPCPECGSILLTKADFEAVLVMEGKIIDINALTPESMLDGSETKFDLEMDGSGKIVISEKED